MFHWQTILTVLIVVAAVFYLLRQFVAGRGCERCAGGCAGKSETDGDSFVPLESLSTKK